MTYETTTLPALSLLGYTASATSQADVPGVVGPLFGRLLGTLGGLGLDTDQPVLAWYGGAGTTTELGVGLPTEQVPGDRADLQRESLDPVERAVVTRYTGDLEGIGTAWAALHQHVAAEGLRPDGPCREVYLQGSIERSDPWIVDLQQPVA